MADRSAKKTKSKKNSPNQVNTQETAKEIAPFKIAGFVITLMFIIYLILIFIWKQTSPQYPPVNFLDLGVRTPVHQEDWLKRRVHGV